MCGVIHHLIETAENESQLHSSGKRAVLVFRGVGKTFYNFRGEKVEKVRQHLRLRCLGWVGWQDWETNHIAEEELCWFGGRETCQQLTDQVGRLANSRQGGGGASPRPLLCSCPCLYRCLGFLLDPNCYKLNWVVPGRPSGWLSLKFSCAATVFD